MGWTWILLIALGAFALVCAGLGAALFSYAIVRKKKYPGKYKKKFKDEYFASIAWYEAQEKKPLEIQSRDGLALRAQYLEAKNPTRRVAIVVHGHKDEGKRMAYITRMFHEMGLDVLVPDLRAHGQSEGRYFGMGYLDRVDLSLWIRRVIELKGDDAEIVLHGISMGAAAVMMTAGFNPPANVKCVVEDCGYTSAPAEFKNTVKTMMPFVPLFLVGVGGAFCRVFAGYRFSWVSPIDALKSTRLPILFIHGEQDKYVPFSMLDELYESYEGPKQRFAVPEAVHAIAYLYAPDEYTARVEKLLETYMPE